MVTRQQAFLRIPVECIPAVTAGIRAAGYCAEADSVERYGRHYSDPVANAERVRWLELAKEQEVAGEIEFDEDAATSESEHGCFVMGWVWVDAPSKTWRCGNCGFEDEQIEFISTKHGDNEHSRCPSCGSDAVNEKLEQRVTKGENPLAEKEKK